VIAHAVSLPRIAIEGSLVVQAGTRPRRAAFGGSIRVRENERVLVTVRVQNRDPAVRTGVRVSLTRYAPGVSHRSVIPIGTLAPGATRLVTFTTTAGPSRAHALWVVRAGARLGSHYRNGTTAVELVRG
jgi:hypothetical protein